MNFLCRFVGTTKLFCMRLLILLLAGALLSVTSCSKNSDNNTTPSIPTSTFYTLYGSAVNDVITINTTAKSILYQGQAYSFTVPINGQNVNSETIAIYNQAALVATAQLNYPIGSSAASLHVEGNSPTLFGSSYYFGR